MEEGGRERGEVRKQGEIDEETEGEGEEGAAASERESEREEVQWSVVE